MEQSHGERQYIGQHSQLLTLGIHLQHIWFSGFDEQLPMWENKIVKGHTYVLDI